MGWDVWNGKYIYFGLLFCGYVDVVVVCAAVLFGMLWLWTPCGSVCTVCMFVVVMKENEVCLWYDCVSMTIKLYPISLLLRMR